jgi:hypothetical protein
LYQLAFALPFLDCVLFLRVPSVSIIFSGF